MREDNSMGTSERLQARVDLQRRWLAEADADAQIERDKRNTLRERVKELEGVLQWMSNHRALIIFAMEVDHVADFFSRCDATLAGRTILDPRDAKIVELEAKLEKLRHPMIRVVRPPLYLDEGQPEEQSRTILHSAKVVAGEQGGESYVCQECGFLKDTPNHLFGCQRQSSVEGESDGR